LLENCGSVGYDVGFLREAFEERRPVLDSIVGNAEETDVRGRADEALLEVLAKAVIDG
jgi:hypothetical protein